MKIKHAKNQIKFAKYDNLYTDLFFRSQLESVATVWPSDKVKLT